MIFTPPPLHIPSLMSRSGAPSHRHFTPAPLHVPSLMSRGGAPPRRPEEPSTSFLGKSWSLVEVYRAARMHKEERLEALRRLSRKELDLKGDKTDVQRAEDLIAKCSRCPSQSREASEDDSGDTEKGTTKNFDVSSDHTTSTEESTDVT